MFDRHARRWIDPWVELLAARVEKLPLSADAITLAGFAIGILGCGAIATANYRIGLVLILLNRLADGFDGAVARRTRPTDRGGFLDIVLDTIFYSAVPFAFGLADPARLLSACFLIFSFVGTGGSFLAYAVISAKRGIVADRDGRKSFFHSVGLMEGAETIVFFTLFCLWPGRFAELAWIFGGLCWLTTAIRIGAGLIDFRDNRDIPMRNDTDTQDPAGAG